MTDNLPRIDENRETEEEFLDDAIAVGNIIRSRLKVICALAGEHINQNNKEFLGVMLGHLVYYSPMVHNTHLN